jgi:hypothetical protein
VTYLLRGFSRALLDETAADPEKLWAREPRDPSRYYDAQKYDMQANKPAYWPELSRRGNHGTIQELYRVLQAIAAQNGTALEVTRLLNDTGLIFMATLQPQGMSSPGQTNIASLSTAFELALRKEYPRGQIELINQSSIQDGPGPGATRHRAWFRLMSGLGDGRQKHSEP